MKNKFKSHNLSKLNLKFNNKPTNSLSTTNFPKNTREHSLVGKAQLCHSWNRVFNSPCSLITHPHPLLRFSSHIACNELVCADKLSIIMLTLNAYGISAIQTGFPIALILMCMWDKTFCRKLKAFKRCKIAWFSSKQIEAEEGCLSTSKCTFLRRANTIVLIYVNLANRSCALKLEGIAAVCLQHELDHTRGKLILD